MRAGFCLENLQESGRLVDVGAEVKTRQQIHPKRPPLIYQVTRLYIAADYGLHSHCHENITSHTTEDIF